MDSNPYDQCPHQKDNLDKWKTQGKQYLEAKERLKLPEAKREA